MRLRFPGVAVALAAACALICIGPPAPAAAAGTWSGPVLLSPPGENSIDTKVAMNARGDAAVVWKHRIDPWHSSIEVTSRSRYGPFTAPVVISNWQVVDPRVVLDGEGNAVVVWAESGQPDEPTGDKIRASVGRAGGSFGAPVTLMKDTTGVAGTHNVCVGVDAAGAVTAFWTLAANDWNIRWSTRPAGGSFGPVGSLPNASDGVWFPTCAVSANGDTFAAWSDGLRIQVAVRPAGRSVFAAKVLRPLDGRNVSVAHLFATSSGEAVVAWSEPTDDSGRELVGKASLRQPGGSFGAPETVARSNGSLVPFASDAGRIEVYGFAGSQLDTPIGEGGGSLTRGADGRWGGYEQWTAHGWEDDPAAAYDDAGNLYVANRYYYDREWPRGRALATIRPAGGTFPAEETAVSADGHNVWLVALAAAGTGHAIEAWPRGEVDDFHIELVEYGGTPRVAGPAGPEGGGPASPAGGDSQGYAASGGGSGPGIAGVPAANGGAAADGPPPRMSMANPTPLKTAKHRRCRRRTAHGHRRRACARRRHRHR
jgi:hypothetical protein